MTDENATQRDMPEASVETPKPGQAIQVGIRLQPVEHSEQPTFSNFAMVQEASGVVFIDFGFLPPQALTALARLGQPGVKVPEGISGNLTCRMALSLDTAANLAQQLNQLLRNVAAAQTQRQQAAASAPSTAKPDLQ